MKAANTYPHRMHRTGTKQLHQFVTQSLNPQPASHFVRGDARQFDGAAAAEKVRRGQQVDMQAVALDPLAAVKHPAHVARPRVEFDAEQFFQCLRGGDLIRHRADAADTRHHVGDFGVTAAFEKFLEEARRLEDAQAQLGNLAVLDTQIERALAFHPGQHGTRVSPRFDVCSVIVMPSPCLPRPERPAPGC